MHLCVYIEKYLPGYPVSVLDGMEKLLDICLDISYYMYGVVLYDDVERCYMMIMMIMIREGERKRRKERERGSSGHKNNKNKSNKWCVREREIGGNRRYFLEWWWYLYIKR